MSADEGTLPPEARALLWHLRSVADTLTDARDGCLTARPWAHQLLDDAAPEPESGVIMNLPTAQRPPARRIVCGVDGSEQARHAASAALRLADRLGARLTLVHVTPTRTVVPVDSFPMGVDPSTYPRSSELAFSEAEARSTPCRPTSPRRAWSARCGSASPPWCSPRSPPTATPR